MTHESRVGRVGVVGVPARHVGEELANSAKSHSCQMSSSHAVRGGIRRPSVVFSHFRDIFNAEPAFHLRKQSLDRSPETAPWTPIPLRI